MTLPDERQLIAVLRRQGMPEAQAQRMAGEWLDHCDDIREEGGATPDPAQLLGIMGSLEELADAARLYLPTQTSASIVATSGAVALVGRWTGACTGGLLATVVLFAALSHAIAI
ncbi:MAG: hypothetical protein AAFO81_06455 [Pseudomonadota bacterium]